MKHHVGSNTAGGPSRRSVLLGLAGLPVVLAACSAPDENAVQAVPPSAEYPVTIRHMFGETVIGAAPQRIATIGASSADICLSLNVVPVGMPGSNATPWFVAELTTLSSPMPVLYPDEVDPSIPQVGNLEPDLILAVNSDLTQAQYDELTRIAPVIAGRDGALNTDWRTSVEMVAQALGQQQGGVDLEQETTMYMAESVSDYPDLPGTTFLFVGLSPALGADFELYGEESNPVRILEDFGLVPGALAGSAEAAALLIDDGTGPVTFQWPRNRGSELDSDIVIASIERSQREELDELELLADVPAEARGSVAYATRDEYTAALETGSPLGIRWIGRNFIPELARAAYYAGT
ncbi:ABC transporter substrate-binding protein [Arthrobacter sp. Br18]|uniref:ABC transporter substrate-binding protein n=1 Tax=Arthrobacter sp. Br18 TaxID=1312954 RepID=UPI0004B2DD05|nr:ABC transporter substrate-binding protein [Arthrobacter sp. Br18]